MTNKLQCKDIPDLPILKFLYEFSEPGWCTWFPGYPNSIANAMPDGIPRKLIQAKMNMLMRRGLVSGCNCGCRGDYELTDKGINYVEVEDLKEELIMKNIYIIQEHGYEHSDILGIYDNEIKASNRLDDLTAYYIALGSDSSAHSLTLKTFPVNETVSFDPDNIDPIWQDTPGPLSSSLIVKVRL